MVPPTIGSSDYSVQVSARDSISRPAGRNQAGAQGGRYPQPTLLRSLFDRRLMALADRGGASGHVGKAWGEISGAWLVNQVGQQFSIHDGAAAVITDVIDIDSVPGLPGFASSRGLQNPDFLVEIETQGERALTAADAKFSIETGKPKQVSADIVHALLDTEGSPVRERVHRTDLIFDGFFVSPDFDLTRQVLNGRIGILRAVVSPDTVIMIPADPTRIFADDDLADALTVLEGIDVRPSVWRDDLVSALYYGRCAFACLACHIDETRPLLGPSQAEAQSMEIVIDEIMNRRVSERSAWSLVTSWDEDAEAVRGIRIRVHQAAELGIPNRALRELVEREAGRLGVEAPSMNRVRRDLALWANGELIERFGVIHHPVDNLNRLLGELRRHAQSLERQIPDRVRQILASA